VFGKKPPLQTTNVNERMRLLEVKRILLREFDAAQDELDQATSNQKIGAMPEAVQRYVIVLRKLRLFLADGKIPADVKALFGESGRKGL